MYESNHISSVLRDHTPPANKKSRLGGGSSSKLTSNYGRFMTSPWKKPAKLGDVRSNVSRLLQNMIFLNLVGLTELYYAVSHPAREFISIIEDGYRILLEKMKDIKGAKRIKSLVHYRNVDDKFWLDVIAQRLYGHLKQYPPLRLTHGGKVRKDCVSDLFVDGLEQHLRGRRNGIVKPVSIQTTA
ncbi:LOW QUALITY PROTEIN: hypothetical protein HID58_010617 [Brassica napus]|uniref:Uncharacterized protein n=1 Tax=Brassica napus TaxID=3708 RepID=A0ABQ8DVZ7_BRANA|nr:LOW QUALITY PROTEIN: hypothetical protein HID58_010617 [Brassica napus]